MIRASVVRLVIAITLLVALTVAAGGAGTRQAAGGPAKPGSQRAGAGDGWPDTHAGQRARGWVVAFSTGEEAMRAYLKDNMTSASLEKKGVPKRIETYRDLHGRLGTLVLASIDDETAGELKATLLGDDAKSHRFVFTVQTQPPFKLISVGMLENHMGGHFGFGH